MILIHSCENLLLKKTTIWSGAHVEAETWTSFKVTSGGPPHTSGLNWTSQSLYLPSHSSHPLQ